MYEQPVISQIFLVFFQRRPAGQVARLRRDAKALGVAYLSRAFLRLGVLQLEPLPRRPRYRARSTLDGFHRDMKSPQTPRVQCPPKFRRLFGNPFRPNEIALICSGTSGVRDALPPKTVFAKAALVLPVFAGSHILASRFIQCAALIPTDGSVSTELGDWPGLNSAASQIMIESPTTLCAHASSALPSPVTAAAIRLLAVPSSRHPRAFGSVAEPCRPGGISSVRPALAKLTAPFRPQGAGGPVRVVPAFPHLPVSRSMLAASPARDGR